MHLKGDDSDAELILGVNEYITLNYVYENKYIYTLATFLSSMYIRVYWYIFAIL